MSTKITIEGIEAEPWGPAFVREFDLTIAANELRSMRTGATLYNDVINTLVAERCAPLDGGLKEDFLGVRRVGGDGPAHRRVEDAVRFLADRQRGTWAVFELDGAFDAYMADGCGGIGTESGRKFTSKSPDAPRFAFLKLYAAVLSMPIYLRRNEIRNHIHVSSHRAAGVEPGCVARDVRLNGVTFSMVEFERRALGHFSGGEDALVVLARRRGARPASLALGQDAFMRIFGVAPAMPEFYEDDANETRLAADERGREPTAPGISP